MRLTKLIHRARSASLRWPLGLSATPRLLIGPEAIEIGTASLRAGSRHVRTFAVTGYPRDVGPGWLEPLLTAVGTFDVAVHMEPVAAPVAAERLRKQRARLESARRIDLDRGRLADPELEVAAEDALDLARRVARGEGRLFRVGLYMTVTAADAEALEAEGARLRDLCASLLLASHPCTFRALQGWTSTLPLGVDRLRLHRTFDTQALAAAFPFVTTGLASSGEGVFYGISKGGGAVVWDRFEQPNYNSVILARSGAGKSYLAKLEVLRSLYRGIEVLVVDPENEYERLTDAVGGTYVRLGGPGVHINAFDMGAEPEAYTQRALFVHTLVSTLLGATLDGAARAALDRAVVGAYAARGITSDPRTHRRPAPQLADLVLALGDDDSATALHDQLAPFVTGSYRGLFDGPTTAPLDRHLVVFSLRDLPEELKPAGLLLTLDVIWRRVVAERRRRFVVVDEAWQLMRQPEGARFLFRLAKSARRHWCGLTVVSQDAADLLSTDLGMAVVANAATQILLRQAPQAMDAIGAAFRLSEGERSLLLAAERGEALLAAGMDRVAFRAIASPEEHRLITTDPHELAADADAP
jgi:type IV secretory pathway VirB4 component